MLEITTQVAECLSHFIVSGCSKLVVLTLVPKNGLFDFLNFDYNRFSQRKKIQ